jgi:uncharacterized membrane protein YeaQ/YmgE (transglycosylase-associated protein family)
MKFADHSFSLLCRRLTIFLTLLCLLLLAGGAGPTRAQAADTTVSEKVGAAADEAGKALQDAGHATKNKLEEWWRRIDESRLKNRTRDEIVAWLIMGFVVASVLAQTTGLRRVTAYALGLVGALLGGIIVHVSQFDLGLGPVLIRYEDLLFSLVGSLLVVLGARWFLSRRAGKGKAP